MGQIAAADGAILQGADTVATTRGELKELLKTVESQMLAIGSGWEGPAAQAFQGLMVRWNEESSKVTNALVGFEDNLRSTQRDYDVTDQAQVDAVSKIAGILGGN